MIKFALLKSISMSKRKAEKILHSNKVQPPSPTSGSQCAPFKNMSYHKGYLNAQKYDCLLPMLHFKNNNL